MAWVLAIFVLGAPAQAGRILVLPGDPTSHDTLRFRFEESDWFDRCPPELTEVRIDGPEIMVFLEVLEQDDCQVSEFAVPYKIEAHVGSRFPGTYNVAFVAPDYTTGRVEVTEHEFEVVEAVQCGLSHRPAATVLLPYFEVDLDEPAGRGTLFSVGNAGREATLAHAVIWTNWRHPVASFDFFVAAGGVVSLNVRDLLEGRLPQTSPPASPPDGYFGSCTDPMTSPAVDTEVLKALLTGRPHPGDGLCYSAAAEEGGRLATGFITVDVVRDCSAGELRTPDDEGYFGAGGTGLATNDNLLWGDFYLVDPSQDFAQGSGLLTLVADPTPFVPFVSHLTFYRQGIDRRMPLPWVARARFLRGGGFSGETDLLVWFEGRTGPVACGVDPAHFQIYYRFEGEIRSQDGAVSQQLRFGKAEHAFRTRVGAEILPTEANAGHVDLGVSIVDSVIGVTAVEPRQIWTVPLISASGRFSVGLDAIPVKDFCRD